MYYKWLDDWDEKKYAAADVGKKVLDFELGGSHIFHGSQPDEIDVAEFKKLAAVTVRDTAFYELPHTYKPTPNYNNDILTFPSPILTESTENNVVHVKRTSRSRSKHALIFIHPWRAENYSPAIANILSRFAMDVYGIALPYHLERSVPGKADPDSFISPNLGKTIRSIKQAVLETRQLISFLKNEGYNRFSIIGVSLGSWVAGLTAAHDSSITKASFLLSGGNAAHAVWSSRSTRLIKKSIETQMNLEVLSEVWAPINLENYANLLAREELKIQFVLGKRDTIILPEVSENYIESIIAENSTPSVTALNCGHASLSRVPYNLITVFKLLRFLR